MEKQTFNINGMTCASCARRIETELAKLPGVLKASVNLASEKLYAEYEGLSADDIKKEVNKIGYEAYEETDAVKATLNIAGMSCASCAASVERALKGLDGIAAASVNLATEKASVSYHKGKLRLSEIKEAVEKAGYRVLPQDGTGLDQSEKERESKRKAIRAQWRRFAVSAFFALPLLYIAMAPMISFVKLPFPGFLMPMEHPLTYALTELVLVLPIIGMGYRFYTVGFRALWRRSPNMDSLIAIGTTAAVVYSLWSTFRIAEGNHMAADHLYYETAGVIITLILLGKTLEAVSKGRTGEAIRKLMGLAPKTAFIARGGEEKEIPVDEVEPGDIIIVKPGAKIPVDGTVTEGNTAIDESMLTGESMPADKKAGDSVYAATINTTGTIRFRAEKVGRETALAQIIKLVEDAQGSKAPIAKLADVVSGYFVPAVCAIALIAGLAWFIGTRDFEFALTIFISVLVIACPCALGLATPTAIMVGSGRGAEEGILFKGGEALEIAHKINAVVFDKTGTLTEGKPSVTDIIATGQIKEEELLILAASAEKASEHPLGRAVVEHAAKKGAALLNAGKFTSVTGQGIEAFVGESFILAGNRRLMDERGILLSELEADADRLAREGKTPVFIALNGRAAGIIAVADVMKKTSRAAVERLHKMGIETVMITGDNKITAEAIALQTGIDRVLAQVLPKDKASEIKKLQGEGLCVAMVGDGINDAPALAQADLGIAIGSGTDVAIEAADIVLMRSDPYDVPAAFELSEKTIRNIKQNLFWAFGYNTIGIPLAAGVLHLFGGPLLNPIFAAAAMSLSSVSVLANALRLKKFRPKKR